MSATGEVSREELLPLLLHASAATCLCFPLLQQIGAAAAVAAPHGLLLLHIVSCCFCFK